LKTIALTLRGSISAAHNLWSGVLNAGGDYHIGPQYDIDVIVDRIGGGDAFAAGLIYSLRRPGNDAAALNFAIAASCLKHTVVGDFNFISVAEVEELMKGGGSGRIQR
jgi:2-dehydro-3-deoxygluconokinase